MNVRLKNQLEWAVSRRKDIRKWFDRLKQAPKRDVDEAFHEAHFEAFRHVDCLDCANCCKTTGPLFTEKDVARISRYLKMSEVDFHSKFLRRDEDGDTVLQAVPCHFLGQDNKCSIYSVRPEACADYPHTHRMNQKSIRKLTQANAEVCPAVARMVKRMMDGSVL